MYAQFPNSNSQTKIEAIKCHPILLENNSLATLVDSNSQFTVQF